MKQKQMKEDFINYYNRFSLEEKDKATIKYIRGSKNSKGIKRAFTRVAKYVIENSDLDLCEGEQDLMKAYNLIELKRNYEMQVKEQEDAYKERERNE